METKILCFCSVLCLSAIVSQVHSSAIPMWEFLSKDEKRSFLYSLFANQVEELCEELSNPNCNQELLKYGLGKLKDMSEDDLDMLDPYQRGATNMIWESMMNGHELKKTTPKPRVTTTAKPNSYDDQSFANDFDSESEASARIESNRVLPPSDFVFKMESGTPEYVYPNQIQYFEKQRPTGAYSRFQNQYRSPAVTERPLKGYVDVPLTGPMVVKVYPDGRPVNEPYRPVEDEDLRQYKLAKVKIPNF